MSTSGAASNRAMYIGLGVVMVTGIVSYIFYKYKKRDKIPSKWRRIGTLNQINLFAIKSCAPLKLSVHDELYCDILGLRFKGIKDRCLMLVNEKYEMVTARIYPKMVLVSTKVVGETKLIITAEGMEPLELDFATLLSRTPVKKEVPTSVWGSNLDTIMCGEKYDKWFSRHLLNKESGLHLVYYPHPQPVREVNARLTKEPFMSQEDTSAFADVTSYMLMNLASVDDLNTRLLTPVDALQFRGNFHLNMDSKEPYAEDKWQWVRIGKEATFRKVAPCTRCILPNINVKTGERNPHGDPLKELKKYRLLGNYASPAFGIHLGLRQAGPIKTYDIIYVNVD